MNERHQLMDDKLFWVRLEHEMGAWLGRNLRRGLWADCLVPEDARDTKHGVDIVGSVIVDDGNGTRDEYRLVISVPQKMLHRRRHSFRIEQFLIDEAHRTLEIRLASEKDVS